ncbi:MAG: HalOD1 output domain-containing protein [Halovenus sp.]
MSSDKGGLYIMRDDDDDEQWIRPTPAGAAIVDAVLTQTDLSEDELSNIHSYVDRDELRTVLEDETADPLTFAVGGHDVTVAHGGEITVEN